MTHPKITLKGKVQWEKIHKPGSGFKNPDGTTGTPFWSIDVLLTQETRKYFDAQIAKVSQAGDKLPAIKADKRGNVYIRVQRKCYTWNGKQNGKPITVDDNGELMRGPIWNGSECIVECNLVRWKNNFGTGISLDLESVQVMEMADAPEGYGPPPIDELPPQMASEEPEFNDDIPF